MTDQEIEMKVAEACGWRKEYTFLSYDLGSLGDEVQAWISPTGETSITKIPRYTTDLNAMQAAVLSRSRAFQLLFMARVSVLDPVRTWAVTFLDVKAIMDSKPE